MSRWRRCAPRCCCGRRRSLLSGASAVAAQTPVGARRAPPRRHRAGQRLDVTLMTFGQGEQVFERFGHNALWFHDPARGTDVAYNWGLFDSAAALPPALPHRRHAVLDGGEDAHAMIE